MPEPEVEPNGEFEALLTYLKRSRGLDLTGYKRPSLMRRVCKRMQAINVSDFNHYVDYLEVHPEEFAQLFNTILINVTGFFRDPQAWEVLATSVLPKIIANNTANDQIRVWTAGCATGEETYSIAMLLVEALGPDAYRQRVKLYASDVDEQALLTARQAIYDTRFLEGVKPEWIEKYFERNGDRYTFRSDLRLFSAVTIWSVTRLSRASIC